MSALTFGYILLFFLREASASFGNLFNNDEGPGIQITKTDAPFMAYVPVGGCDAVIVHKQFLVAAGHCVLYPICEEGVKKVIVGDNEEYDVEKVIINPRFLADLEFNSHDRDIAVIKLNKSLTWNDNVQAAVIPEAEFELRNEDRLRAIVSLTKGASLLETKMLYKKQEICKKIDFVDSSNEDVAQNSRTLCAAYDTTINCATIRPGLLFLKNIFVGLPWPSSMCLNQTSLFTRVSEYHSFVSKTIKENL